MTNWTEYPSAGERVTRWNYHPLRGWLVGKVYPDGRGPSYTYKPSGRPETRLWARGARTTYDYNAAGELQHVGYANDNGLTPPVGCRK